jgi:phosphoglycolate phosphatase-like HAD superfamily hydrolase
MRVKAAGMKIVLAMSAKQDDLAFYEQSVGMDDLVEEEATSSDAQQSKPEPDIFAEALKKAGSVPEEAIASGDTPYDAEAAGNWAF